MKQKVSPVVVIVAIVLLIAIVAAFWFFTGTRTSPRGGKASGDAVKAPPSSPQEAKEKGTFRKGVTGEQAGSRGLGMKGGGMKGGPGPGGPKGGG